jgi:uncharacterized protein (TIGR02271 family)
LVHKTARGTVAAATHADRGDRNTCNNDNTSAAPLQAGQRVEVPVVEERLEIQKRKVETGEVVVLVEPRVEEHVLDVPLVEDAVEIRRVPVNEFVDGPVAVRQEGDVTIMPVYEEVLVVEKRLMLREEIHFVRKQVERHEQQTITLRKEEVLVLRSGLSNANSTDQPAPGGTTVANTSRSAEGGTSNARGMEP